MKTTTVMSSELGDDWTPRSHMPRAVCEAQFLTPGDRVRVRDHSSTDETKRRWHLVTVEDVENHRGSTMAIKVNKWPIAYMCSISELVELVEIKRTVSFRCIMCPRTDDTIRVTVTLDDFFDPDTMKRGGLDVVVIDPRLPQVTGYCKEHGTTLLS